MPKRAKLPYSWIEREPGVYKVTASWGKKPNGARDRKYTTIHAASQPEMHVQAADWIQHLKTAKPAPVGGSLTLKAWLEIWMREHVERELELSTQQSYRRLIHQRILPILGHIPLKKITPQHIAMWLEQLNEEGQRLDELHKKPEERKKTRLSGASRMRCLTCLSSALKEAVCRFYIAANPCATVRRPKVSKQKARIYQTNDLKWLMGALDESPVSWRAWILLALACGLRRGELCALEWCDIDWKKKTVTINEATVAATGHGGELKGPKSDAGIRVLPVPDLVLEALQTWKTAQAAHRQHMLYEIKPSRRMWKDPGDHICTTRGGQWLTPDALSHMWAKWVSDNELPKVTLHGLRHTAASVMIAAGIPVRTVSSVLGHSQTSTTMNIYAHLIHDSATAAADAMGAALSRNGDKNTPTRE